MSFAIDQTVDARLVQARPGDRYEFADIAGDRMRWFRIPQRGLPDTALLGNVAKAAIPKEYQDHSSSGLSVVVKAGGDGETTYDIVMGKTK